MLLAGGTALGAALVTGLVEFERAEPPWADPLPEYAKDMGYTRYRWDQGGFGRPGTAERVFDRTPPDPSGPLIVDRRHSSKQPEDSRLGLDDYSYPEMHGFGRAFDPMRAAGIQLRPERRPIDADALAGASGLFINLPSGDNHGFRHSEVLAIDAFVRAGGGLVLITDHSNCYFHGEMLTPLARALGFSLPPVTATDRGAGHTLSPASVAWLRVSAVPGHPVTEGVGTLAMVTAGVVVPEQGQAVLAATSGRGWIDRWTPYRKPKSAGFTGELEQQPDEPDIAAPVAIAGEHGAGRVVVLGDQNAFGASFVGYEDTARLFANAIAWTTRRDVPLVLRGPDSVTTLTGARSLCTAAAPYAYRTLQVTLQKVAGRLGRPEHCTIDGDVTSRALLLLPESDRDDLPTLLSSAERVLALIDVERSGSRRLLDLLGLAWVPPGGDGARLRWSESLVQSPDPVGDHPVFATVPAEESLPSRVPAVQGASRVVATDEAGRPIIVSVEHDGAEVLLLLDATLLDNTHMKGERTDPTGQPPEVQASHRVALRLLAWLAGPAAAPPTQ